MTELEFILALRITICDIWIWIYSTFTAAVMIIKQIKISGFDGFCYIVGCERTVIGAVIDPGGNPEHIAEEAKKAGVSIAFIIHTHGHIDHTAGTGRLKQLTDLGAVIDPGGNPEHIAEEAKKAGVSIAFIIHTHGHIDHTAGTGRLKQLTGARIVRHRLEGDKSEGDILLDTEETFTVGDIIFTIFHTPGHTPGGICLYAEGNLFTGDTLFVGDSGRTDLTGSDRAALGRP